MGFSGIREIIMVAVLNVLAVAVTKFISPVGCSPLA
jgi:hypothetical protein